MTELAERDYIAVDFLLAYLNRARLIVLILPIRPLELKQFTDLIALRMLVLKEKRKTNITKIRWVNLEHFMIRMYCWVWEDGPFALNVCNYEQILCNLVGEVRESCLVLISTITCIIRIFHPTLIVAVDHRLSV